MKIKNCHPKIEDGTDLRLLPQLSCKLKKQFSIFWRQGIHIELPQYSAVGSSLCITTSYLLVTPLPLKMRRFVVILQFRQITFSAVCLSWFLFSDKSICSCLMSCQSSLFTSVSHLCPQVSSRPIGSEENRPMRIRDRLHLKSTSACFCCQVMPAASLFVCKREGGSVWSAENDFSISFSHDPPSSRHLHSKLGNFQCSRRSWKIHW